MAIRLVILDVDGVVKQAPDPYTILHNHFGTAEAGARYLRAFLGGHITYEEFAQLDARQWRGRSVTATRSFLRRTPYVDGAHALAAGLRARRIPLILLSSGFDLHVADIAAELRAADFLCNNLDSFCDRLLGSMTVHVPWGGKGPIVRDLLAAWGVEPEECLTAGDSDADIPAFAQVAHAVAVRPRSAAVSAAAHLTLPDLTGLLTHIDRIP